jgi:hypothetical protein
MAKNRKISAVVVQHGGSVSTYLWATDVRVDRKGNLRVFDGLHQRAFHPAGEWDSYVVKAVKHEEF